MRYTAFLVLGLTLILLQGMLSLVFGPTFAELISWKPDSFLATILSLDFRPSLLVPLLVYLGVTETNLALGACVAFLLGYVLDVVSGAPIGLHAFTSVATVALAHLGGLRLFARGYGRAAIALAAFFSVFSSVVALVLLAIFGRPYVPRALLRLVAPQALATGVVAPLVYWLAAKTQALVSGFLGRPADDARRFAPEKLAAPTAPRPIADEGKSP